MHAAATDEQRGGRVRRRGAWWCRPSLVGLPRRPSCGQVRLEAATSPLSPDWRGGNGCPMAVNRVLGCPVVELFMLEKCAEHECGTQVHARVNR
eukprot:354946-Chlamydomonas_euryale.AAC.2